MGWKRLLFLVFAAVSGCSQVISEQQSTITVDGRTFPLITQTMQSGDRTFEVSFVVVKNQRRQCLKDSPGDCEAATRESRRGESDR